jgi:hypothetical protein
VRPIVKTALRLRYLVGRMSKGTDDLVESWARLARAILKAGVREMPRMRKAAGRIVRDDVPHIERTVERAVRDLRNKGRR